MTVRTLRYRAVGAGVNGQGEGGANPDSPERHARLVQTAWYAAPALVPHRGADVD